MVGERLTAGTMCRMTDHANEVTLSCGTTADERCSALSPLALAAAGEAPPHSADADVWVSLQLSGIRMASCTYSQVVREYKRAVKLQGCPASLSSVAGLSADKFAVPAGFHWSCLNP